MRPFILLAAMLLAGPSHAQDTARPFQVLKETVTGMPRTERQEISVLRAEFAPGQATVFHTHRFPVTVHVLEGTFTLELEGRAPWWCAPASPSWSRRPSA
jgi:quercetin dioxygenase-like cupin family protein